MRAHTRRSPKFGKDSFVVFASTLGRNGGRATKAHNASQATPKMPLKKKAPLHPRAGTIQKPVSAIGTMINGAATPPRVPPLNDSATARARRVAGSDSTAV